MEVGDLHDRVAVGGGGQARERDARAAHDRPAAHVGEAVGDDERGRGEAAGGDGARVEAGRGADELRRGGGEQQVASRSANHVYATNRIGLARSRPMRRPNNIVSGRPGASATIASVATTVTAGGQSGAATNRHQM